MYSISPQATRELIDKYFSLQWCRDNYVIPISIESNQPSSDDIFWIAIANYAYLGTIANPIKERIKQNSILYWRILWQLKMLKLIQMKK